MGETFLIARHMGEGGAAILKIGRQEAIEVIRKNRGADFQLAVLGGKNINSVQRVYGEYAPYYNVSSIEELLSYGKKKPVHN